MELIINFKLRLNLVFLTTVLFFIIFNMQQHLCKNFLVDLHTSTLIM